MKQFWIKFYLILSKLFNDKLSYTLHLIIKMYNLINLLLFSYFWINFATFLFKFECFIAFNKNFEEKLLNKAIKLENLVAKIDTNLKEDQAEDKEVDENI